MRKIKQLMPLSLMLLILFSLVCFENIVVAKNVVHEGSSGPGLAGGGGARLKPGGGSAKPKPKPKPTVSQAYSTAKSKGSKTANHSSVTKSKKVTSLPKTGKAYSSKDFYDGKKVKQRRYYDKNGKAQMDIDYTNHGNAKAHPKVPHRHNFDSKGNRGKDY
ncbi:hypothetical protein ACP0AK_01605 [Listeria ivanovii]|uniref:Uncharacterized protein n=1 Tax=Listeria ivanovii (strain ATCC BAA-678 / PAM 55) TaxID=881621 RepID=G2Z8F5_LISIP|nr:hypothetical protein [Listeria ivanovii]AHI55911.1 hypothetical protein AX25_07335 [Listeria ivanovii WSLC3009]AIS65353.1 hypothetical protein JL52_07200 [Listeria ivanovii subsp. ivanovii]MBC1759259.1 hypothetical protein [Listeria ivanovii]MBK3914490.1 hypothetical protein [Listeria ivanovii subsp. ivanovii]MBK3921612.1 hypothetical protein [Listeria ivanovii subsp. ivanovii]